MSDVKQKIEEKETDLVALHRTTVTHDRISKRSFYLWMKRGCTHGYDVQDWLQAEKELLEAEVLMSEQ
ncbi:MAG: DUF2934 domain-containing protein [Cyanobacteria bacterium]|nr:DUF2934 domain-containing protein [Cyanobacteriota bacterium]